MGVLPRRFNRILFRRVRRQTGTQAEWARLTGVTQTTIGNWERGFTAPSSQYRSELIKATAEFRRRVVSAVYRSPSGADTAVDIVVTDRRLRRSILRAALTDFEFSPAAGRIVPVPFKGDYQENLPAEIEEDRRNLLSSLTHQTRIIIESLEEGANINVQKFRRHLESYQNETESEAPNPRLLNRLGTTISRITNSDDFRNAANAWDVEAVDGFNKDHIELMRLYFKEALAKAQEIDGSEVRGIVEVSDGEEFRAVAGLMDSARSDEGDPIIDEAIPTLLRDIANEIRDLDEAATFTTDPQRSRIFNRRKNEAFKNGGVYVGRFVFFSALIVSLAVAGVGEIVGVLGAIVGLTEGFAPGTIRAQYENLRSKFPALPSLPSGTGSGRDDED